MKNPLTSMQTEVKNHILRHSLLQSGDCVLLAVSGGADSLAMLDIMQALSGKLGFSLCVAHFDHLTRGGASTLEGEAVAALCRERGLPFYGGRAEEGAFDKGNFEAMAREARYAFLRRTAAETGCSRIATAHQRDDLAETLLLHLLRGCGTEGLAAIAPAERDIIRPILCLSRQDTELYCREAGLDYAHDCSNDDTTYLRNKLRLEIMPQLEALNPRLADSLCRTAEICREENAALGKIAAEEYARLREGEALDFAALSSLPAALQSRVLRLFAEERCGVTPNHAQTRAMTELREGGCVACGGKKYAFLREKKLFIESYKPEMRRNNPVNNQFNKGYYDLGDDYAYRAELSACDGEQSDDLLWLPADMPELHWRVRRAGDKLLLKGMNGHKSVKDIMSEAALPQQERDALPLLVSGETVLWVPWLRKASFRHPRRGELAWRVKIFRK